MNHSIEIIPISKRVDGTEIHLKKISFGDGSPKVFLGASIHGNELTSLAVLWKLIDYMKISELEGSLTMIMGMNPEGIAFGRRTEPYFNVDLNRMYPGDHEGSLPERITNIIYGIAAKHDIVLDLHTAGDSIPFILIDPIEGELRMKTLDLAKSMGITVLEEYLEEKYELEKLGNSLPPQILKKGIPSFTVELPGSDRIDWTGVSVGFKSLLNLLIHLGMVDSKPNEISETYVLKETGYRRYDVTANNAGIIENFVHLGDEVDKYMPLGVIRDLSGNVVEWVKSSKPGYIIALPYRSIINPADHVYLLAVK